MRLYTFQPKEVWEQLQQDGILIADPYKGLYFNEDWNFQPKYDWLKKQYSVLRKNGEPGNYLWWAYPFKPDLRWYRTIYSESIMMVLDVPDEEVLILDADHWCMGGLNGSFVASSFWESLWFEHYEVGLPFDLPPDSTEEEINRYDDEHYQKYRHNWYLEDEWSKHCDQLREERKSEMFNPDFARDPNWWGEINQEAVFEFLKLEYVKKVVFYKGLKRKK